MQAYNRTVDFYQMKFQLKLPTFFQHKIKPFLGDPPQYQLVVALDMAGVHHIKYLASVHVDQTLHIRYNHHTVVYSTLTANVPDHFPFTYSHVRSQQRLDMQICYHTHANHMTMTTSGQI